MYTWVPLAFLINAAFAANLNTGFKTVSHSSTLKPAFSKTEFVLGGSGLNAGSALSGAGLLSTGLGSGASVISSSSPVYSTGAIGGAGLLASGLGSGASVISSSSPVYSSGAQFISGGVSPVYSTGSFSAGGDASILSTSGPTFGGAELISSTPGAQVVYNGVIGTSGVVGAVVSRQAQSSPGVIKNAYKTITEVEPGKEIVLRAQAQPQVHKKVELVAQVVKPKVEVTRVMAPPKVEHKVLVRQQKPQIVKIMPQMHTTTIVKEAPKPKPQMFLSQKRRQTIAKKIEIDQHKITAITPEHGYDAGYNGGAVVSTFGNGAAGFNGGETTFVAGNGAAGLTGVTGGETTFVSGNDAAGFTGGETTFVSGNGAAGLTGVTGGETTFVSGNGAAGFTGGETTFVSGNGAAGFTGGETTFVSGNGAAGFTGGETIVAGNGMTGGETMIGGGETVVAGNAGNDAVIETSNSGSVTTFETKPRFTFGKLGSASRFGTKM